MCHRYKVNHIRQVSGPIWLPMVASIAGLASAISIAVAQTPLEEWTISSPVYATNDRSVMLHRVTAAAVVGDGVVIADAGNQRLLLLSASGTVTDSLGRRGSGPGEFQWIHRVFASGDTVIAFDGFEGRVTVWVPGSRNPPQVTRLPTLNSAEPTELYGVLSASTWILGTRESIGKGSGGLRDLFITILAFNITSREVTTLGRRRFRYAYFSPRANSTTTYSMAFLGAAQVGVWDSQWYFVPLDRPVIELHGSDKGGGSEIALPLEPMPYASSVWRRPMDSVLAIASGDSRDRLRTVYNQLARAVPRRTAPPVRRAVRMGMFLWVEVFERATGGESQWLVTNLVESRVQARVVVDDEWTVLGGTDNHVVILTRTDLGEDVIEVRAVIRGQASSRVELQQDDRLIHELQEDMREGVNTHRRVS